MPFIETNGIQVHYHLQGRGTPIVFLHPPCIGSRVFTYIRNDLSQDHKTLLFDLRGHGRSSSSQTPITIPLLAEDIHQLLDKLKIPKAVICAYSMATMVALQSLLTYSDRIRGAILLGGAAEISGLKTRTKIKAGLWAGKLNARDLISVPLAWAHADNHETFRRIRGETLSGDMAKWREYMNCCLTCSLSNQLKNIKQPVLLLCAERDREFKGYMKVLQQGLSHHSSAIIPGVRHTMPIYGARAIGDLIREWIITQQINEISDRTATRAQPSINPVDLWGIPEENLEQEGYEPHYH